MNVFAISMDSLERAAVSDEEWETGDLPLAHSLGEDQAREWGLFISQKRADSDEPEVFSEPGLFLLRPDRKIFLEIVQSAPFTRPGLDDLIEGIDLVLAKDYPPRGTLT